MKVFAIKLKDKLDNSSLELLLALIDKKKRERLEKFVFWQDLQRGLFADLFIRKVIVDTFGVLNEEIEFGFSNFGKPYIKNINDFHFNISHSGDWIVCVIDKNSVGIDIEKISTINLDISKNFFSNKEHEDLMLSNEPFDYFFKLWTLKESYIKYLGKGLSHPLNSFTMHLKENGIKIESEERILNDIFFKQYNIEEGYKLAACGEKDNFPQNLVFLSLDDLLSTFKYN